MSTDPDDLLLPGQLPDRVRALLLAAAAPAAGPQPGEEQALAAFRANQPPTAVRRTRTRMIDKLLTLKVAAATLAGGVVLAGGAAAASGSLPDAAQQKARDMLAKVGVSVPGPEGPPAGTPVGDGGSGQGERLSEIARDPDLTGVEKGAAVSDAASDGKSRAGEHGLPAGETGQGEPAGTPGGGRANVPAAAPLGGPSTTPATPAGASDRPSPPAVRLPAGSTHAGATR